MNYSYIFGDTHYAAGKVRQEKLRRPQEMPLEDDVKALKIYTTIQLELLVKQIDAYTCVSSHLFKKLRDLIVCRLTLFNGLKGGRLESRIGLHHSQLADF